MIHDKLDKNGGATIHDVDINDNLTIARHCGL